MVYVKNATLEFKAAHLNEKKHLQSLHLGWGMNVVEDNANDATNEEMGLEALCPHPNLKKLKVLFYRGVKPPSWLPSLTNLVPIRFMYCSSIQWLPPFDQLPNLKKLVVWGLTHLERIDVENGGGSSPFFPSLTDLTLGGCPKLKGFERQSATTELHCFPCLSELEISGCLNLTYLPLFPELKLLHSKRDGIESLMEILKKPTCSSTSSSFSTLSQLQNLTISSLVDPLEDELLQYLPSLQHLRFSCCTLRSLYRHEEEEDGMHWKSLKVLRSAQFDDMDNLVSLPKGLQYVTSLQRLDIGACPSLACIPKWMPKLIALQDFRIYRCPQLEERCKNNSAEDWPYISHIPNIYIGRKLIQKNGSYLL